MERLNLLTTAIGGKKCLTEKGYDMNFLNNRVVQILLVVCVIIAISLLVGLNLEFSAGSGGVSGGVVRTS